MKMMFVEAKRLEKSISSVDLNFDSLPNKVLIAYSIQYKEFAEKVKKKLGKRVSGFKQVLGCSSLKSEQPILLIGSGKFHAVQLALQGNKVYVLEGVHLKELDEKYIEKVKDKRKAAVSRFLAAESIGILVSCKPGQENLDKALKLKENLEKKGKETKIFLADNIDLNELENYNLESWVNTACPALTSDSRVVNLWELG